MRSDATASGDRDFVMGSESGVIVRAAGDGDIAQLRQLYHEFHEYHVRGVPDRLLPPGGSDEERSADLAAKLADIIQSEDAQLFVAEVRGSCIGFAEVYVRDDPPVPGRMRCRHGHLQSLMVKEEYRAQGVGVSLLEAAEAWARRHGGKEMRLNTWEFPGDPVAFYERRGYRTIRRLLVRDL
jgi:GNAT superfamily N-acetyltransferase